jgi:hypothetical protein
MNMIWKGQVKAIKQRDSVSQAKLIEAILEIAA